MNLFVSRLTEDARGRPTVLHLIGLPDAEHIHVTRHPDDTLTVTPMRPALVMGDADLVVPASFDCPSIDVCGWCGDSECDGIACIASLDPDNEDDRAAIEQLHNWLRRGQLMEQAERHLAHAEHRRSDRSAAWDQPGAVHIVDASTPRGEPK